MTYEELKDQILSLGFEDDTVLDDDNYARQFRDGINKALKFLNVEFPITERYEVSMTGSGDGFEEIDFSELTDFDSLLNATITKTVNGRSMILPFADFDVEQDSFVRINNEVEGDVTFFYRTKITPVALDTADDTEIVVHYKAEELLSLLAAYYIWMDDDPEKAAKYKNEYEDMKMLVKGSTPQHKKFTFGGGF